MELTLAKLFVIKIVSDKNLFKNSNPYLPRLKNLFLDVLLESRAN